MVQATYLGGLSATYRVAAPTNISMTDLAVSVLVVTYNSVASTSSNYLFSGNGTLYNHVRFSFNAPFGSSVSVDSRGAFDGLVLFNNTYNTAFCVNMRTPYNVSGRATSSTTLNVSWTGPVEQPYAIVSYVVYYRRVPGQANSLPATAYLEAYDNNRNVTMTPTGFPNVAASASISGLQPFIVYEFKVVYFTAELGLGYMSSTAVATTAQAAPTDIPLSLAAITASSTAVTLTWLPPVMYGQNGNITGYACDQLHSRKWAVPRRCDPCWCQLVCD